MNKYVLLAVLVAACFTIHAEAQYVACPSGASQYANCSTCNASSGTATQCNTCMSGFGLYNTTDGSGLSTTYCGACSANCLNCTVAGSNTSCAFSNVQTQDTSSAATPCANRSSTVNGYPFYQAYTAGAAAANYNGTYIYTCYSCPANCTNCTGNSAATANVSACGTCANGTNLTNGLCVVNNNTSNSSNSSSGSGSSGTGTGTGTGTTTTTLPSTATCATTDANGNCTSCPTSYVAYTNGTNTICQVCNAACLNCRVPNDATQCVNSNVSAYNNASSATPCSSRTYPTQTYLAGAVNSTYYNYACYACPLNCTDCTLTNGSKPVAAITQSCKTCLNNTSFQTATINGTTYTGCIYSTSFSTIKAGLTIGAIMTVLVSLLL